MSTTNEYGMPAYQSSTVSQPVMATTSNVTAVTTAPVPVNEVPTIKTIPQNYIILNIFALLFCCFLFGLVGLIYSLQVHSEWNRGNYQGAYSASRKAWNWGIASIITGVVLGLLCAVFIIVPPVVSSFY